ncbi:MAG: neutral zinc metallopeptidase, partial [Actinobacteria bacterium]|nr:neutral zinc metallopeptidase [Actinomycetota bacterium]
VVFLVIQLLGGGSGANLAIGGTETGDNTALSESCTTGDDANQRQDCRIVGVINSVQEYWGAAVPGYQGAKTVFFSGSTNTACGAASSATGPFYCPVDRQVYIDLSFYDELRSRFGASGGPFAEAYVIAHEYGHHIENLTGVLESANRDRSTGPQSAGVRVELMADCYAGRWAQGAENTGFIEDLSEDDIRDGLDAAAAVGDDRIQQATQGRVSPEAFTHGSAEQRQKWFLIGYRAETMDRCDTFAVSKV